MAAIDGGVRAPVLELIEAAAAALSEEERITLLIDGLTSVLDGEVGGFNHVDVVRRRAVVIMRPRPPDLPDPSGSVQRTLEDHPIVLGYRKRCEPVPLILSNCPMGRWRRWKDNPTYAEVFRPMRTPHLITGPLPWDVGLFQIGAGFAVTRSGRDFEQRELDIAAIAAQLLRVLADASAAPGPTAQWPCVKPTCTASTCEDVPQGTQADRLKARPLGRQPASSCSRLQNDRSSTCTDWDCSPGRSHSHALAA